MRTGYELLPFDRLGAEDRAALQAFRAESPSLRSPYYDLGFFDAVAAVRQDVSVLRVAQNGVTVAFLPLHGSRIGMASPVAGPFSDWHGFISKPGAQVSGPEAIAAAGLTGFRFHGAPADDTALSPFAVREAPSHLIDLSGGPAAWRARRGKALHGLDRQHKRIAKEGHQIEFVLDDPSPLAMQSLIAWKREQFAETGQFDQLSLAWTRSLLHRIRETRDPGLRGLLSTLRIDGRVAAVHLGMVSGQVLHYWFPAYDRAFARLGPGALLLDALAKAAGDIGVVEIDLGKGDYRYKLEFADASAPLIEGFMPAATLSGRLAGAAETLIERTGRLGPAARLPSRAIRRLSHTAALRQGERQLRTG